MKAETPGADAAPAGLPEPGDLLGQDDAVRVLASSLSTGRTAGAYLLHGPHGVGRSIGAGAFAGALLCTASPRRPGIARCGVCRSCRLNAAGNHPDLLVLTADRGPEYDDDAAAERGSPQDFTLAARHAVEPGPRRTIPVRTLRRLLAILSLAPALGGSRAVLVDAFDEIEEEGAATLLKTLEEAPPRTSFLLLSRGTDGVPDTILSRCQRVRFRPLPPSIVRRVLTTRGGPAAGTLPGGDLDLLVRIAQGSAGRALRALGSGMVPGPAKAADPFLRGDEAAADAALDWVRAAGRDLDAQRERLREWCALLLLRTRDLWPAETAPGVCEGRVGAVRTALESVDANVSPELVLRALVVRLHRIRP